MTFSSSTGRVKRARGFDTEEATFEGLPDDPRHQQSTSATVALSYRNRAAEHAFVAVAQRFQPDVVHVQHALHLSASLLPACAAYGWPTVLTLHDYWFICPTVQLLRPGGKLCQGPGSGFACFECVGRNERVLPSWRGWVRDWRPPPMPFCAPAHRLRAGGRTTRCSTKPSPLVERPAYMRSALEAADVIVAPSHFLVRMLAANGVDSTRISVCANAVARSPHNQAPKARRAGCAWPSSARCCPTKSRCSRRTHDLPAPTCSQGLEDRSRGRGSVSAMRAHSHAQPACHLGGHLPLTIAADP